MPRSIHQARLGAGWAQLVRCPEVQSQGALPARLGEPPAGDLPQPQSQPMAVALGARQRWESRRVGCENRPFDPNLSSSHF